MTDKPLFEKLMADESTQFEFKSKEIQYFFDTNNSGTYNSGEVIFDLSGVSNNKDWVDFRAGVLTIPIVINLSGSASAKLTADTCNAFAVSLKNGYYNLIDSMQVSINGVSRKEPCRFENMDINYKILSTWSNDDALNYGASLNFYKDSGTFSYYSDGTATNNGLGECNNVIVKTTETPSKGYANTGGDLFNKGRWDRMRTTSTSVATPSSGACFATLVKNNTQLGYEGRNFCLDATSANEMIYYVLATIPLKLFPIFDSMPLSRGMNIRINMRTNTYSSVQFSVIGGGTVGFSNNTYTTTASQNGQFPLQITPVKFASAGSSQGFNSITTANTLFNLGIAIGRTHSTALVSGGLTHPTQTNCRIYLPFYALTEEYESRLVANGGLIKNCVYNDVFHATTNNIAPNANWNYVIPFQAKRLRYLLICPYLSATVNGGTNMTTTATNALIIGSPVQSIFSSAPATVTPYLSLTGFNVNISGKNIYPQLKNYNFEHFQFENRGSNSINGGHSVGLSSGLISEEDWNSRGYNFIYVDLSRHGLEDDVIQKQITVTGTNNSLVTVDYYFFLGYEKNFLLNISNGQIPEN